MSKLCSKCGKPGKFYKNKINSDGLQSQCSVCHLEYTKAARKRFISRNPGYQYAFTKKYRSRRPDQPILEQKKKRATIKACTPTWLSKSQWTEIKQFYKDAEYLRNYAKVWIVVDHIIPLRGRDVCGLHVPWNLQLLTAQENCSKHNKW